MQTKMLERFDDELASALKQATRGQGRTGPRGWELVQSAHWANTGSLYLQTGTTTHLVVGYDFQNDRCSISFAGRVVIDADYTDCPPVWRVQRSSPDKLEFLALRYDDSDRVALMYDVFATLVREVAFVP